MKMTLRVAGPFAGAKEGERISKALKEADPRAKLKNTIGGGRIDDKVRRYARADGYGKDAIAAVNLTKEGVAA